MIQYIHKKKNKKRKNKFTGHYKCTHMENKVWGGAKGPFNPTNESVRNSNKKKKKDDLKKEKSNVVFEKLPGICVHEGGL